MSSSLADKWTLLDRMIQLLRYRQVVRYIPAKSVLADLGCGNGDFSGICRHDSLLDME